jgi:GPH family glycoside/pentoside/hexuronide:cation symporter
MIAWGIGTLGPVTALTATNALLLRYMTDVYGLAAGLAASLIAFSKFYDAFADVAMGVVSDRTRGRHGRRRPYLIAGGVMIAVTTFALFSAPAFAGQTSRVIYMVAMLLLYATAYTVFNIPYMAMPAEMARSYHERTELMTWRVYGVGLAIIVATFIGPILLDRFGGGAPAYRGMALVFAPIIVGAAIVTFVGTRAAPATRPTQARFTLGEQIGSAARNRPFVVLIMVKFVTLSSLGVQAIFPFFFQRILRAPDSLLGVYFLVQSLMMLLTPFLWMKLSRKIGKKRTFLWALALSIPGWLSWQVASAGDPLALLFVRAVVIGTSGSGVILMGQSLLPDTMEYDYRRTGLRREGLFAALYTTVEKLSGAIGVAAVGAILGAYGYVQSRGGVVTQPASALWAIRLTLSFIPAGISAVGMLLLLAYRLDEKSLDAASFTIRPEAAVAATAPLA